jgi:putative ABC transport system permease protein
MDGLWQDIRYGFRGLLKRPGFTAVAVLTLSLGIGANTAIFSMVNAVLLRPLPFKDPERLVIVSETARRETVERRSASYPDFVDWRDQNQVFDELAAFDDASFALTVAHEPERLRGELVSASYFSLLGVQMAIGRTFLPEEDRTPDTHPVVILSHRVWQRRFNADPSVIGKNLKVNDLDYTVVGVAPAGFNGLTSNAEFWIPFIMVDAGTSDKSLPLRGRRWHEVIARLKPGVSIAQAQADMDTIARRLEQAHPETNKDRGVRLIPVDEEFVGEFQSALLILLGAVAFVLLISCTNVANLLLARAAARHKEMAIRAALGASRGRVIRQLLTESTLLAVVGGGVGLLSAAWGVDALIALAPVSVPSFVEIGIDERVLVFTLAVSVLTGILFGLAPALGASAADLNEPLKEGNRGSTRGLHHRRARRLLVVTEVALAVVLLVGAGLMIKSFQRLQAFDPGFKAENVVTARVRLPEQRYSPEKINDFSRQLIEKLESAPSAESVSVASDVPLGGVVNATSVAIEGRTEAEDLVRVYAHHVSPRFFSTLGIPLLRGRDFTSQDSAQAPKVAIISDSMARRFWPGQDALGKRISRGSGEHLRWYSIIGIARDVKHRALVREENQDPDVYFSLAQEPDTGLVISARTTGDATSVISVLRREVDSLDPTVPLYDIATLDQFLDGQVTEERFSTVLLSIFAFLAIALASVGIYGVMSYSVTERTHEFGIRMALGARQRDVLNLVVGQGMALVMVGVVVGLVAAVALTRLIATMLYSVSATDPLTFAVVSLLLAGVAFAACYLPARRATRVDPMAALRYE